MSCCSLRVRALCYHVHNNCKTHAEPVICHHASIAAGAAHLTRSATSAMPHCDSRRPHSPPTRRAVCASIACASSRALPAAQGLPASASCMGAKQLMM